MQGSGLDAGKLCSQRLDKGLGEHRDAISPAFALPDDNLVTGEIDVLEAQAHAFHQPHTGSVEQPCDQCCRTAHALKHPTHFLAREHHRPSLHLLGPGDLLQHTEGTCS